MAQIHGFEELHEEYITELNTKAALFRHVKTGAELLSLINDDDNKVFGITFRTPPADSTGVAHILEHSVLCGSRKYPLKEPFVELLKGSLKTFLNAFTYPDKTCYPVASQNVQDFYNLIDVYLDAVFHPRITPLTLQQEGWHLDVENPEDPIIYKGVVYNEMKGAYSSPETVLGEYSQQSLFPDNTYGLDSGGEPRQIVTLTFDQFKSFHDRYYHPSNARIYFYGNDDPEQRLRFVNERLEGFDRMTVDSNVRLQPHFDRPRQTVRSFAAGGDDTEGDGAPKGLVTLNWLLPQTTDTELNLALHILEYILLGMPGSPLRKALIDSGLGEDLAGVGLESELRQMYFSTGLKGIDVSNADRIQNLIMDTLAKLVNQGIDPNTIEAAVNTTEFRLRENNAGNFPRGLVLMLRALTTWLYDSDPMALLAFEAPLDALKSRLAAKEPLFEGLIERYFLNNTHRTTLILEPDPGLAEKEEAAERERLSRIRQAMSSEELQKVIENTRRLRRMQETPDPPEALATIPTLRIDDLNRKNKAIPLEVLERDGTKILYHDIFTNGIVYLEAGFDTHLLPQKYLQYVPLFGRCLMEMGTEAEDFSTFSQRISRKTGGIHPDFFASAVRESQTSTTWLFLRCKSMVTQAGDLLNILRDMLLSVRMDNRERFRQMALEEKARHEKKLIPEGHRMVNQRLRSHFNEADWAAEQVSGVSYIIFLRKLARMIDEDWPRVLSTLEEMRQILVNRNAMIFNVTLDQANWSRLEPELSGFLEQLPASPASAAEWAPEHPPGFEGMIIPAQINYVGKGTNIFQSGHHFHGSYFVIVRYLRNTWLWDRVRVQGGAYGSFCLLDRLSGMLTFVSYRDPNLLKTLENFDRAGDFLRNIDLHDEELARAIIGTIGDIDTYLLPDARGYTSLLRYLSRDTEEARQRMRDEILDTKAADFGAFADVLETVKTRGLVKVLGSQSAIEDSLTDRRDWLKIVKL